MPPFSPALLERLVARLRSEVAPLSSRRIARELLGIETADEGLASRLVACLVANDPRVHRGDEGWELHRGVGDTSPSLRASFVALFAPPHVEVVAQHRSSADPPVFCVSTRGEDEVARARALGVLVERAALERSVSIGKAARLLRAYRGVMSPDALAHALGAQVVEEAHDAPSMARLVAAGFESLVDELELEGIDTIAGLSALLDEALGEAELSGRGFSREDLDALDEGPGVYTFRDDEGGALYVGQSLSLRARVGSYFCGPPRDGKDRVIRASAHRLDTEVCDSGPDALIREASLIQRLRPRLNTQRQVARTASASGVLVARDPRREDRAVLFALEAGLLVSRGVARGRGARAAATVDRVLREWCDARGRARQGDAGAARLIASWRKARPGDPFFERAITGDDDAIRAGILSALESGRG